MTRNGLELSAESVNVDSGLCGPSAGSTWLRRAAVATAVASSVWLVVRLLFMVAMEIPARAWLGYHVVFPLSSGLYALLTLHEVVGSAVALSVQYVLVVVVALLFLRWREAGWRRGLRVCTAVLLAWALLDVATWCALAAYRTTIEEAASNYLRTTAAGSVSHVGYEITPLVCLSYLVQYMPLLALTWIAFRVPGRRAGGGHAGT